MFLCEKSNLTKIILFFRQVSFSCKNIKLTAPRSDQLNKHTTISISIPIQKQKKIFSAHYASHRVQDFRQSYLNFGSLRTAYPMIPWIVLTHNASVDVLTDIGENLKLRKPIVTVKKSSFRRNLFHDVIFKKTLIDPFNHLAMYVMSCLENVDTTHDTDGRNVIQIYLFHRSFKV